MSIADLEYRVAKLEAKAGDFLIFTTPHKLDRHASIRVRDELRRLIPPDVRALVLDEGADIRLMTADELRVRLGESEAA